MDVTWFVVQTRPRQEERAKEHLEAQGGEVFLPMYSKVKITSSGLRSQAMPLFPGYLFLRMDLSSSLPGKIRSTRGVRSLLSFGAEPVKVDEEIIQDLVARCVHENNKPLYAEGQAVRINSGPFRDYLAIFKESDGDRRAIILLSLLNQQQALLMDLADLTAA